MVLTLKKVWRPPWVLVFAACLACVSGTTENRPNNLDELMDRMREGLSRETADPFLSLFYSEGMDDRVRDQLRTVIERHLGVEIDRITPEPPSDCSWCRYEIEGTTYSLPFQPDGWLRIDFKRNRESRSLETPELSSVSFLYVRIDDSYFLLSSLPEYE